MAEVIIEEKISSTKIFMLSSSTDWYCAHLKQEVEKAGMSGDLVFLEVDSHPECSKVDLLNCCARLTGHRTLPRFWVKGRYLGDGGEMEKALKSGAVSRMLGRF